MDNLDKNFLQESLDTIELERLNYPEQIEKIIYEDSDEFYPVRDDAVDFGSWLEDAEKWDSSPRESVFISEYWSLETKIEELLEENMKRKLENPGLEGAKFATDAIQAQKEKGPAGFSTVIGFRVANPAEKYNRSQLGAPQGDYGLASVPEYFAEDDWFSELEDEKNVGLIVDDHTAYARHIRDNIRLIEDPVNHFGTNFWKAYEETLERYSEQF